MHDEEQIQGDAAPPSVPMAIAGGAALGSAIGLIVGFFAWRKLNSVEQTFAEDIAALPERLQAIAGSATRPAHGRRATSASRHRSDAASQNGGAASPSHNGGSKK